MTEMKRYYEAGRQAFYEKGVSARNPYQKGNWKHREWKNGHGAAQLDHKLEVVAKRIQKKGLPSLLEELGLPKGARGIKYLLMRLEQ